MVEAIHSEKWFVFVFDEGVGLLSNTLYNPLVISCNVLCLLTHWFFWKIKNYIFYQHNDFYSNISDVPNILYWILAVHFISLFLFLFVWFVYSSAINPIYWIAQLSAGIKLSWLVCIEVASNLNASTRTKPSSTFTKSSSRKYQTN